MRRNFGPALKLGNLRAGLLILSILFSGCALNQPSQAVPSATITTQTPLGEKEKHALFERRQIIAPLKQWAISGRMSIQTPDEAWTGKLQWQQFPLNYQILFNTPTGQGAIKIRGDEDHVVLETSKGQSLIDDDEESLLYDVLGWDLPLDNLRQWILGSSESKQLSEITLDEAGNIHQLLYPDWEVKYLRFQYVENYLMPKKLFITGPKLKLRLVIDKWSIARISQ